MLDEALAIQGDAAGAAGIAAASAAVPGPGAATGGGGSCVVALADLDDDHACIACMAALKTTLLIPCGHLVLCANCAAQVLERSAVCPMCRVPVVSHITVRT